MSVRINTAYLQKQLKAGKIKGFTEGRPAISGKPAKAVCKKGIATMKLLLDQMGVEYVKEYRFDEHRKFRFDLAIPDKKIAWEYDGIHSRKSRHTTKSGFIRDTEKTNLAQMLGWQVYRYTSKTLSNFERDIQSVLQSNNP